MAMRSHLMNWQQLEREEGELDISGLTFPWEIEMEIVSGMIYLKRDLRDGEHSIPSYEFLIWGIDGQVPVLLDLIFGK